MEKVTFVSRKADRFLAMGIIVGAVFGAGILYIVNPSNVEFLPKCPLLQYSGYACPGCGMTRGFHALFHGDLLAALDFNALILLWAGIFAYFAASLVSFAIRGKSFSLRYFSPPILLALLVLLIVFGVVRNLPFYPFNILFP